MTLEKNPDCIFCKIAAGEAPSRKLYEDDELVVIVDIGGFRFFGSGEPIPGRVLVIPKRHVKRFHEMGDDEAGRLFIQAKKTARRINEVYEPEFVDLTIRGGRVGHVHLILQPEFKGDDPQHLMFQIFEALMETKFPDQFLDDVFQKLSWPYS